MLCTLRLAPDTTCQCSLQLLHAYNYLRLSSDALRQPNSVSWKYLLLKPVPTQATYIFADKSTHAPSASSSAAGAGLPLVRRLFSDTCSCDSLQADSCAGMLCGLQCHRECYYT